MELVKYVRDDSGKKIGTIVAKNPVEIGWSICHKNDTFNKNKGKFIASNRANIGYPDNLLNHLKNFEHVPPKLKQVTKECNDMYHRAVKYYKNFKENK